MVRHARGVQPATIPQGNSDCGTTPLNGSTAAGRLGANRQIEMSRRAPGQRRKGVDLKFPAADHAILTREANRRGIPLTELIRREIEPLLQRHRPAG